MKKGWLIIVGLLLLLGIASYATTRVLRQPTPPCAATGGFPMLHDYLELTPEQREAIAVIDNQNAQTRDLLRSDVWEAREELRKVLQDSGSTSEQAVEAARKLGEAQQRLQVNTIEYTYELRKHLTPEQREKLAATMDRGICSLIAGPGMGKGCGMGKGHLEPRGQGGFCGGPRGGR